MNSQILNIPDIHVGNMILDYLKSHDRTQSYLARILEMNVANLNKILKKKSMETERLFEISMKLDYNFFKDFYSAKDDPMAEQQNEQSNMGMILRLEELAGENRLQKQEIENLKKENLYLKTKLTEAGIEF